MKKISRFLLMVLIIPAMVSCTLPFSPVFPEDEQQGNALNPSGELSATLTPFQPLSATYTPTITATILPTLTPTFGPSPTPTPWYQGLKKPDGQVNILVMGSDYRPSSGYRTDVMMLVSINPKQGKVRVVSFPRDLWVTIPGVGEERLNTAQPRGGMSLMADTLESNFGVRPDRYIMTNFDGFKNIVNILGGIEVQTSAPLSDSCDLPQAYGGYCAVGPGPVYMDGETALWYVRSRYTSNDFSRTHRAQEVLAALFKKLVSLDTVSHIPEMFDNFIGNVETDLTLNDVLTLAPMAPALVDSDRIQQYFIGPEHVTGYVVPSSGANVLLPKADLIRDLIIKAFFTP
jgi:polyisoprenyl-teichoic acid--peptidoglycan teichoic acid transferase